VIVDCHTHVWEEPHFSRAILAETAASYPGSRLAVDLDEHWQAMQPVDRAIVFGMQARATGIFVPNDYVAGYVRRYPDKLIGFASVDPNDDGAVDELTRSVRELGLRGLKLGPIYQHIHPHDPKIYRVYRAAESLRIPILIHQGATYPRGAPLEYAPPLLLERVALDFPELKLVIAHLGHPWEADTIVLIRKQPNVYSDVSALYYRPWQFYNSMRLAQEYGVQKKLLLGSDYPFTTPASTIEQLRALNDLPRRSGLPTIDEAAIEALIHRDTLAVLGIPDTAARSGPSAS
jgi:predicted TIM-barrel fold metal-dependent hydrolase